jgi:hypothetical protein
LARSALDNGGAGSGRADERVMHAQKVTATAGVLHGVGYIFAIGSHGAEFSLTTTEVYLP